ncbi:hypothetical protein LshimejAT787_0602510 [Lyophyllum shimeji]|uniref:Uncharacterized protein n=1 Tax=Lyophyllum shimeji TaxID=47721 RepID=A0A9P3PPD7_LYOSH|nr:hypothetical protein LshimejAT787_0602510 [Lyophyllum shimeji]
MDDDHDVLDWGNEDDDQKIQDSSRPADQTAGEIDDAEDAVSLGEEEDDQEYYALQQDRNVTALATESSQFSSAEPSNDSLMERPSSSRNLKREDSSTSQVPSSTAGSPRRNSPSTTRSPQRPPPPRLTHALPPKPVVTNVPFLPPSHPSIVEATAMSVATRSTRSTGKSSAALDSDPLPRHRDSREPRSSSGGVYQHNSRTSQSTWTRPVSNSNSSPSRSHSRGDSTRHHRGSNLPAGYKNLSPPRSDHPPPPSQETSRHTRRAQPPPDAGLTDLQETATSDVNGLSYEDRHYRPGGAEAPIPPAGNRRADRNRVEAADPRFNPHPDRAFTPPASPPRARGRARSLSPLPVSSSTSSRGRESRPARPPRTGRGGRDANTDADSSIQRDREVLPASFAPPRSRWNNDPLTPELNSSAYQESRRRIRPQDEAAYDGPVYEGRPPMPTRSGSLRGRNRDRDQIRALDLREQDRIQNIPSQSTLSASSSHLHLHLSYAGSATVASALLRRSAMSSLARLASDSLAEAARRVPLPHPFRIPASLLPYRLKDAHHGLRLFYSPSFSLPPLLSLHLRVYSSPPRKRDHRTRDEPRDLPPPREQEQTRAIPPRPVSPQPPPQPKRERTTRFGQPAPAISPTLTTSAISPPRPIGVEPQAFPPRPIEQDDPFVPDDIRSPPREEIQARRDVGALRNELTVPAAPPQIPRADVDASSSTQYPNKHPRLMDDRDADMDRVPSPVSSEQVRLSPSSAQVPRPTRVPLPPQEAEFREQGWQRAPRLSQGRPPLRLAPSDSDGPQAAAPRDQQPAHPNTSNVPSGPRHSYSQGRGDGERAYPTGSRRYTDQDRDSYRDSYRDKDRDTRRGNDRRSSAYPPPPPPPPVQNDMMDVDSIGLPPRPPGTRRRSSPLPKRLRVPEAESALLEHPTEEKPPAGPRAMATNTPPAPTPNRSHGPTSPVMPFAHAPEPSSRTANRSPPPDIGGRMHDGGREREFDVPFRREAPPEWPEERRGYPPERGGRRDASGRDFHRSPAAAPKVSGANDVPIGTRKGLGNGGPPGAPYPGMRSSSNTGPGGMGGMSSRPMRGGNLRGRGGGPPHSRRDAYERQPYSNDDWDSYRSGRGEGDGLPPRRREISPPPFEKHQPLSVDTAVAREPGPYSAGSQPGCLDTISAQEPARLLDRTWAPRGASPPREAVGASVSPTPPPISREPSNVSPSWDSLETGRPSTRYSDTRPHERPGISGGAPAPPETRPARPGPDELPPRGRDRRVDDAGLQRRNRSLEGRLGERYEEPSVPTARPPPVRQPHALPPNPALHRDHPKSRSPDLNRRLSDRRPMRSDYGNPAWENSARKSPPPDRNNFHGQRMNDEHGPSDGRIPRSSRPRKYPPNYPLQDELMGAGMDLDDESRHMQAQVHDSSYPRQRTEMPKRGGSLLDRMGLDDNGYDVREDPHSLRGRVQVPSKRDREDMMGDRYGVEDSFEGDDGDPTAKKMRRKPVKPRRANRNKS